MNHLGNITIIATLFWSNKIHESGEKLLSAEQKEALSQPKKTPPSFRFKPSWLIVIPFVLMFVCSYLWSSRLDHQLPNYLPKDMSSLVLVFLIIALGIQAESYRRLRIRVAKIDNFPTKYLRTNRKELLVQFLGAGIYIALFFI